MLTRISDRINYLARGWLVLLLLAMFIILITIPIGDPALISASLDGRIGYTAQEAFSAVASYGEEGRTQMIWIHFYDFFLILLYSAMFSVSISWLFQRGFQAGSRMHRMNLIPILGGLFDAVENIWILVMILVYPARPMFVGWLAAAFTLGKYVMGIPIILLLLIGLVKAALNRFKVQEGFSR